MFASLTPRAMRPVVALVGVRNAGKSSLLNALCGEEVSIVSDVAGTTTDAVAKAYELLPFGAVTFYDTAGLDDSSLLGLQRVKASHRILKKADLALLVIGSAGVTESDKTLVETLKAFQTPVLVVFNKTDVSVPKSEDKAFFEARKLPFVEVSARTGENIDLLKGMIASSLPSETKIQTPLLGDLVSPKDILVLVAPIDDSAPKNRLILPQVQVLREILDLNASAFVCQPEELKDVLSSLEKTPRLVICDSQAVLPVAQTVPQEIDLTTFSILFARFKGDLKNFVAGAAAIDKLSDGSKVLIAEACAHHIQDGDIARVKIPALLKKYTGKNLDFSFVTGGDFASRPTDFELIIHCGGCMINQKEMLSRQQSAYESGIPMTNYGLALSKAQGTLERVLRPFHL